MSISTKQILAAVSGQYDRYLKRLYNIDADKIRQSVTLKSECFSLEHELYCEHRKRWPNLINQFVFIEKSLLGVSFQRNPFRIQMVSVEKDLEKHVTTEKCATTEKCVTTEKLFYFMGVAPFYELAKHVPWWVILKSCRVDTQFLH